MSLTPTQLSELQTIVETLRTEFPNSDDDLWQAAIRLQKGGLGPVTGSGGQAAFDAAVADIVEESEQISTVQGSQGGLGASFDIATFNVVPIEGELPAGALGDVIYIDTAPNTYLATDVINLTPAGPNSVVLSEVGTQVARTVSAANGGLEVNNLNTGAGFERVLTTSDGVGGLPSGNVGDTIYISTAPDTYSTTNAIEVDPSADVIIRHASELRIATEADGIVRISSNDAGDPGSGGAYESQIRFTQVTGLTVGEVGYRGGQSVLDIANSVNSAIVRVLGASGGAGANREMAIFRPLAEVELYFAGVNVAETLPAASGGLQVNNTLTGAGFERVLTTSDAGGGSPFATPLDITGDINTATPPTTEAVTGLLQITDLAGDDILSTFGFNAENQLRLSNFFEPPSLTDVRWKVNFVGGTDDTFDTFLEQSATEFRIFQRSGTATYQKLEVDNTTRLQLSGVSSGLGAQTVYIQLTNRTQQQIANIGMSTGTDTFTIENRLSGGNLDIITRQSASTRRGITIVTGTEMQFYHPIASNQDVMRTTTAANGGIEVNNLSTGGGYERVLTTSDIGGGSPFTTPLVIESAGNTTTEARLLEYALDNGTVVGRSGYVADSTLVFENVINTGFIEIAGDDTSDARQLLIQLQPNTGGRQIHYFPEVGASIERFALEATGSVAIHGDLNADSDTRRLLFRYQNGALQGLVGHNGSDVFELENRIDSAFTEIRGRNSVSTGRVGLRQDPDDEVTLFHCGTNNQALRTLDPASGGVEINNTLTGAGFERALTESDQRGVVKSATTSRNSTTTASADPDLQLTLETGDYIIEWFLYWNETGGANQGIRFSIARSGGTIADFNYVGVWAPSNVSPSAAEHFGQSGGTNTILQAGDSTNRRTFGKAVIRVTAGPTTISVSWAQAVNNANNTNVISGSAIHATKIG